MRTFIIIAAFMLSNAIFEANDKIMSNNMYVFFIYLFLIAFAIDGVSLGIKKFKRKNK